jgi:hypothetical protein
VEALIQAVTGHQVDKPGLSGTDAHTARS